MVNIYLFITIQNDKPCGVGVATGARLEIAGTAELTTLITVET